MNGSGWTPGGSRRPGVNPAGKVTSIIAGMAAGADSIDDLQLVRSGGMKRLFTQVYAPATLGQFLREFTHGHTSQLASVARAHLIGLTERTNLLPGIEERAYVDIDSLLRPVYGKAKQGASFGHTKIAGKQVLRKGLSPLATTISTDTGAPVIAGIRLRAGKSGSGRAAGSMTPRGGTHRPRGWRHRRDPGPRGLRVRPPARWWPPACTQGALLARAGQERGRVPGDRGHRRGRLHPGALPRRGHRPGHRRIDQ